MKHLNKTEITAFQEIWEKINNKLVAISAIKKLYGDGQDFEGVEISEAGIQYKTSTWYSGCGTDYFDFFVSWEELTEPIEYFQKKYQDEIDKDLKEKTIRREAIRLQEEEKQRQEYLRLKEKFEK